LQRKHKAAPGLGAPWPSFCNSAFGKFGRFFWRLCVAANATQNLVFQKNVAAHDFNAALIQPGDSYFNQSLSRKLFCPNPTRQQRVCMKRFSQFGLLAGDKGHRLNQVVFAHGGLEVG
jgi:hypothetical protein